MSAKRTPEFEAAVRLMSALMGLTLAMKARFGEDALPVAQRFAERLGMRMGNRIKARAGISGIGIRAAERLYHAWLDPTHAPYTVDIEVKGNALSVTRTSPTVCLGLVMAKQLQLPLETVCHTCSQPFFKGIAKAINPNAVYSAVRMSGPECIETIELPGRSSFSTCYQTTFPNACEQCVYFELNKAVTHGYDTITLGVVCSSFSPCG